MSILEESVWFLSLGLLIFFSLLGLFCLRSKSEENQGELTGLETETFGAAQPRISFWHLLVLGIIITAIQLGQYTCDKQMKTENERIVLSP